MSQHVILTHKGWFIACPVYLTGPTAEDPTTWLFPRSGLLAPVFLVSMGLMFFANLIVMALMFPVQEHFKPQLMVWWVAKMGLSIKWTFPAKAVDKRSE